MPNKNNPGKRGPDSKAKGKRKKDKPNKEETTVDQEVKKEAEEGHKEIIATEVSFFCVNTYIIREKDIEILLNVGFCGQEKLDSHHF